MAEVPKQTQAVPKEYRRTTPQNELDLAMMTTDSVWGKPEINPELQEILNTFYKIKNADGTEGYTAKSLWSLLSFYTRDMRLANLDFQQMEYCMHYINLAGDCLQEGLIRPFAIALSRAATMLELSQSKGGFLRKRQGTLTSEHYSGEKEPPKRNFFGGSKRKGEY